MTPALVVTTTAALVALLALVLVVRHGRTQRHRVAIELRESREELEAMRVRLDGLAARLAADRLPDADTDVAAGREYLITSLSNQRDLAVAEPAGQVNVAQFASVAAAESLVRVASLAHGVRRALAPEQRNRIRFEMRRQVRRSRKLRRGELREARRHLRAQRSAVSEDAA